MSLISLKKAEVIQNWIDKQLRLIKMDYDSEVEQNLQSRAQNSLESLESIGQAIRELVIVEKDYDIPRKKLLIRFSLNSYVDPEELKKSSLMRGSVGITSDDEATKLFCIGFIKSVDDYYLNASFTVDYDDKISLNIGGKYNLVKVSNDITYRRMSFTLENLSFRSWKNYLIRLLFGIEPFLNPWSSFDPYSRDLSKLYSLSIKEDDNIVWFNENLDPSQKEAIKFSLKQKHFAIIHGPPGTGKTTTLVELILQMISRNMKVVVCAPSNVAVDNIFKQFINSYNENFYLKYDLPDQYEFARLGNNIHVDHEIRKYLVRGFITENILNQNHVVMTTLNSANFESKKNIFFDVVIIDECAQALEASCWIPLINAKKCILAGDHYQLPATISSYKAEQEGLGVSILKRTIDLFKDDSDKVVRMLTQQYRMNHLIMDWSSKFFYNNQLMAAKIVANRKLENFPVIRLIDTAGCCMDEMISKQKLSSKGNIHEVKIVCLVIKDLISQGIEPFKIGVIAPYNLQIDLIKSGCNLILSPKVSKNVEINSVDGFQGREKEVIILSLVRSNETGSIGFLTEDRRLNVAITRARSHLTVVCDTKTVCKNSEALRDFISYCKNVGSIEFGKNYQEEMDDSFNKSFNRIIEQYQQDE